jgi:hypothetical protein
MTGVVTLSFLAGAVEVVEVVWVVWVVEVESINMERTVLLVAVDIVIVYVTGFNASMFSIKNHFNFFTSQVAQFSCHYLKRHSFPAIVDKSGVDCAVYPESFSVLAEKIEMIFVLLFSIT